MTKKVERRRPEHPREKRPRGRPTILSEGIEPEAFVEAYNKVGSARKAAKKLGVDEKTVRKYLRMQGFQLQRPRKLAGVDSRNGDRLPKLTAWLRDHPGQKLPRTIHGIAYRTGISENTVLQYFRRRKARLLKWLKTLPMKFEQDRIIVSTDGVKIPSEAIASYEYEVDLLTLEMTLKLWITFGAYMTAKVTWQHYLSLIGHSEAEAPWNQKLKLDRVDSAEQSC